MTTKILISLITVILLESCAGVKFASAPVNRHLPEAFTQRALYPAGVAGYDFQDLVGNILSIRTKNDPVRIGVIRPSTYKNEVIPVTDPNNYYKSRIQKGAEAGGSYLAFAASFSTKQLAELELIDIARAGVVLDNDSVFEEIITKANTWVNQHPRNDTLVKRLWIKTVVLTRKIYSDFTDVGANAKGQVGDVVGVSTGVYNKSEENTRSVLIAFEAFDIDELVAQAKRNNQPGLPQSDSLVINKDNIRTTKRRIELAAFTGIISGMIKE